MTEERSVRQLGTRRTVILGALLSVPLILWLTLFTWSYSQAAPAVEADTSALVMAESPDFGQFITDNNGRAIYIFLNDTNGVSACEGNCLVNWPPVLVPAADSMPTLPEGMDAALLGTIERPDGTFQLTFNGWPLYYFVGDTGEGMTTGQAQGEVWYLLSPQGTGVGLAADQLEGGAAP